MRDETCKMLSQELIGEVDQDGNGCITFNEFVWLMTRLHTNGKKTSEEKKQILH